MKILIFYFIIFMGLSSFTFAQKVTRPGGGGEKDTGRPQYFKSHKSFINEVNKRLEICAPHERTKKNFQEVYEYFYKKHVEEVLSSTNKTKPSLDNECYKLNSKKDLECVLTKEVLSSMREVIEDSQFPHYLKKDLKLKEAEIEYQILFLRILAHRENK